MYKALTDLGNVPVDDRNKNGWRTSEGSASPSTAMADSKDSAHYAKTASSWMQLVLETRYCEPPDVTTTVVCDSLDRSRFENNPPTSVCPFDGIFCHGHDYSYSSIIGTPQHRAGLPTN